MGPTSMCTYCMSVSQGIYCEIRNQLGSTGLVVLHTLVGGQDIVRYFFLTSAFSNLPCFVFVVWLIIYWVFLLFFYQHDSP